MPLHERRSRLTYATLAALTASAVAFPAAGAGATKPKPCKASELKQKVGYRSGGKARSVTACIPRAWALTATPRQGRAIVVKLAPKQIAGLLRGKAARRVSAADPVLDGAIATAQLPPLVAASVGHGSDTQSLRSPPGTTTSQTRTGTEWSDSEPNPGADGQVVIETKGKGASKKSTYKLLKTMSQCPDAGGVGRGVIKMSVRETQTTDTPGGGHGVTDTLTTYDAEVLVHFNDDAAVQSVEVIGGWSWATETRSSSSAKGAEKRLTRYSVDGGVTGSTNTDGRKPDISTNVKNATSSSMAVYGMLFGAMARLMVEEVHGELVRDSASRARSGACARIVPDPPEVHVKPGQTVALTAALNDAGGAPLPGTVKAAAEQASVSPDAASADPTARFTYSALAYSPPGRIDKVNMTHVSKRGRASPKTVTVIYDEPPAFPQRFEGTWTRVDTIDGLVLTFKGTAAYTKNPLFGPENPGTEDASVPYIVESARVDWSASGSSVNSNTLCTHTYSGSGTDVYSEAWHNGATSGTRLSLQDIRRGGFAPATEPQPYHYSISANGDTQNRPKYTITYSGTTHGGGPCTGSAQETIPYEYLKIGSPTYDESHPPEEVEKGDSAVLLEGHRFTDDGYGSTVDDTWRFTGSG